MSSVDYITVEENNVDIREWRLLLSEEELGALVKRMDEDLHRATSIIKKYAENMKIADRTSRAVKRSRKLAAKGITQDDDDDG